MSNLSTYTGKDKIIQKAVCENEPASVVRIQSVIDWDQTTIQAALNRLENVGQISKQERGFVCISNICKKKEVTL